MILQTFIKNSKNTQTQTTNSLMRLFKSKPIIHHFKIHFPIPTSRVQSCISKIQQLSTQNTQAIFLSLNGFCNSPQIAQTLHNTFKITNEKWNIPVYTFLEEYTTALTYLSSTCGIVSANPYCVIGDVGTAHKTYSNIEKLLKYFDVKLDLLSCHKNQSTPFNAFVKPSQQQKQLARKWLNVVQDNMITTISQRRKIPLQTVKNLKHKVFTPSQALAHNLIDHIQTAQQFKATHFPQVKVQQHLFAITSKSPNIAGHEIKILMEIEETLSMPRVPMYSMEDPMKKCVGSLVEMVMARLETPEKLEELDLILGKLFRMLS